MRRLAIKCIFLLVMMFTLTGALASFAAGYVIGVSSNSSRRHNAESYRSKEYDYMIVCEPVYEKLDNGTYKYECPNPPEQDEVLFMSTLFNNVYWPIRIIYYMKKNKRDYENE